MNQKIFRKILNISRKINSAHPEERNRHYTFLIRKNKILTYGLNSTSKTHPLAYQRGYHFYRKHSEISAILRVLRILGLRTTPEDCKLVNIRLSCRGEIRNSRPCYRCQALLKDFSFREVWYSTDSGHFERFQSCRRHRHRHLTA